ncbi:MAG: argininosuccinate lyase [Balneolaceae bacterium]
MAKLWESADNSEKESSPNSGSPPENVKKQVESFTVGNDYILDQKLLPYDIRASKVHAEALHGAGILSADESTKLKDGLDEILALWEKGEFEIRPEHEDGHTAIELWLTDKFGDLGKKIHTGRSRNDQVLTAVRLYEKDHLGQVSEQLRKCALRCIRLGQSDPAIPMPGFTHTRRAMLSSTGQWTGGYAEMLILQLESVNGIRHLIDKCPLGTAAGFGSSIDLDRDQEAASLGFSEPILCATTAQLSRGWVELQLVQYLSGITGVLNRMAGDIILYSSEPFGFFRLGDEVCTGSSIMPQKKNPDVAELIRGKHSKMEGYAATLQGITRNLGSGYHRDLQLTKEPVILAFGTVCEILSATVLLLDHLSFDRDKLSEACSSDLQAAESAYRLVTEEGWSFRDAYKRIKSGKAEIGDTEIEDRLQNYTQLGSPGNPGLGRLKERLENFKIGTLSSDSS